MSTEKELNSFLEHIGVAGNDNDKRYYVLNCLNRQKDLEENEEFIKIIHELARGYKEILEETKKIEAEDIGYLLEFRNMLLSFLITLENPGIININVPKNSKRWK